MRKIWERLAGVIGAFVLTLTIVPIPLFNLWFARHSKALFLAFDLFFDPHRGEDDDGDQRLKTPSPSPKPSPTPSLIPSIVPSLLGTPTPSPSPSGTAAPGGTP